MRHLLWRRVDAPGMGIAHVESFERATGTQLGVSYELRWALDGRSLELEMVGGGRIQAELGDADFFDVFASPFFNSLPVARDELLEAGEPKAYTMRFVQVQELEVLASQQRYEPLGGRVVRYSSGSFSTEIEFDEDGFVTLYRGFLERVA